MRVVEFNAARLVIEEAGTGFGIVCVLVGHALVLKPFVWPPWYWWTGYIEGALGVAIAIYGALSLTKTTLTLHRQNGTLVYSRRNFFGARFEEGALNEVEDVLLQRGSKEPVPYQQEVTFEEKYPYRVAIRVRGEVLPLTRTYHDYKYAQRIASLIRGVLDEWAMNTMRPA